MGRILLSTALGVALFTSCHAAPLALVQGGRSNFVIYVAAEAPASVKGAAAELRDYVQKATGAPLPIVNTPREPMICLGDNPVAQRAGMSAANLPMEGFRIVTKGRNLYILGPDTPDGQRTPQGGTSTGTRNGVYAFLERFLGIRFLMPGPHGDYIPKSATVILPETDVTDAPFFRNRRVPYTQERRPEVIRWWERQRLGWSLYLSHGHNWDVIPPSAFDAHPDWFAERGGVRVPPVGRYKLCVTNEGLIRAFADAAIRHFDQNPESTCFSLSPSDSGGWCECARCTALYEKDPEGHTSVTPAILTFYNNVARLVAQKYPQKLLAGYVYAAYVYPPRKSIRLEPNVFLVWAPSFDYGFTLFRPEIQKRWETLADQWTQVTENIAYYDLPNCVHNNMGAPNPPGLKILKFLYPRLKRAKMKGVYVYGNPAWGYAGPMNYLLARLAWDPDADVGALFNEFCERAYAEGAPEMKRFYELLDAETERYFLAHPEETYTLSEGRLRDVYARNFAELERLYRTALAKIRDPEARARLEMLGENLTVLHWNLRQNQMLENPTASTFYLSDANFTRFLNEHRDSLALAESREGTRPRAVGQRLRTSVVANVPNATPPTRFRLRGPQHLVLQPTGNGAVTIRFPELIRRGTMARYAVYRADGTEVASGLMSAETPITFEAAGSPYFHVFLNANSSTMFALEVAGAAWAVDGNVRGASDQQGLHFQQYASPVYFEVPAGIESFSLWLSADPPGETALAILYAPDGREVAAFDCTQVAVDRKKIPVRPGDAGFWKLVIRPAPTGVMDDVYVSQGAELSGYFSLVPSQALSVGVGD